METFGAKILADKRQSFRITIRKSFVTDLIDQRRKLINEEYCLASFNIHNLKDMSLNQKQQILESIALKLRSEPSHQWDDHLTILHSLVREFQGLFERWINLCIVQQVALLFESNYRYLQLTSKAANLLSTMVAIHKTPNFVETLIQYGTFYQDLFQILHSDFDSTTKLIDYLYLTGNIVGENGNLRNRFVASGYLHFIIQISNLRELSNIKLIKPVSWIISNLVKQYNNQKQNLKYNTISSFLPILNNFVNCNDPQIIQNVLFSLRFLLSGAASHKISNVMNCMNLVNRIIQFISWEQSQVIRQISVKICLEISSNENPIYCNELMKANIIDSMYKSLQMGCKLNVKSVILGTIYNIVINSNLEMQMVLRHNIFEFVVMCTQVNQNQKLKQDSLQILYAICSNASYSQLQLIELHVNILEIMVNNIRHSKDHELNVLLIGLKGVEALIKTHSHVFTPNSSNTIVERLERHYDFSQLCQELMNHTSTRVQKKAMQLFELISSNLI